MAGKSGDGLTIGFVQRVLFIILMIGAALLAFRLMNLWLLIFGAIVIATVLRALAEPIMHFTRLPAAVAVGAALLLLLTIFSITFYLFGREIAEQAETLTARVTTAWAALQVQLQGNPIGRLIQTQTATAGDQASGFLSRLPGIAGNVLSSLADCLVALIGGIILAVNPARYRDGVVYLFPTEHHERIRTGMNDAGQALRLWFIGQFISMIIVGTAVGVGLALIGRPSALALGLLAGMAQFIPLVGPTVSAGTGSLLAAADGLPSFALTLILYTVVSQTEANFITPLIQRRVAEVPMVLTLFAVIAFAGLLGPIGVVFAMPLTVMLYTLVRRAYDGGEAVKPAPVAD